jgi:hypothetical protein
MSFKALSWAAKQQLPAHAKLVLLMLADRADEYGRSFPSVARLVRDCGIVRSQVQKCMSFLEQHELIRREARTRSYGQTSNMYYLNLDMTITERPKYPARNAGPPARITGAEPVSYKLSN